MEKSALTGRHDASTIDLTDPYELTHWTKRFGISEQQLRDVVARVGVQVDDVVKELEAANRPR